jgi:uncharacterized membrane protein
MVRRGRDGEDRTVGRIPGWRRAALPASIVLNLFLLAAIGGHLAQRRIVNRYRPKTLLSTTLADAQAVLPPAEAQTFAAVMDRDRPQIEDAARQLAAARRNTGASIEAEPFDAAAVKAALDDWRVRWNAFFDAFSGPLVEALSHVSVNGRRELVSARGRR